MAGDFGEILAALFQATSEHPGEVIDPMKWRLKHDRTKPASGPGTRRGHPQPLDH
jgi:hypothetical protein